MGYQARKLLALVTSIGLLIAGSPSIALGQFTGTPSTPQPLVTHPDYALFDIQVHSRAAVTWDALDQVHAQHGSGCEAPPTTHPNTSYEGAVFICNNHVMTAINGDEYGVIYLTPARILDCTSTCSVQWEMSTHRTSARDWPDVMVTPWEDNLALPLLSDLSEGVDLQGPPRNTVWVGLDNGEGAPVVKTMINGARRAYNTGFGTPPIGSGVVAGTNQMATRQTFRLTMTPSHIRMERLASATAPALVYFDGPTDNFKRTNAMIVQFGHHSYDPMKDCGNCTPNTWHWDNMILTPSTSFSMIHAQQRATSGGTVTFNAPAPSNAYLRFSAICAPVIDGVQSPRTVFSGKPEHFSSYFVPIAQGKQSVQVTFRADGFYSNPCRAKDFTIWSQGPGAPAPAAPSGLHIVPSS